MSDLRHIDFLCLSEVDVDADYGFSLFIVPCCNVPEGWVLHLEKRMKLWIPFTVAPWLLGFRDILFLKHIT